MRVNVPKKATHSRRRKSSSKRNTKYVKVETVTYRGQTGAYISFDSAANEGSREIQINDSFFKNGYYSVRRKMIGVGLLEKEDVVQLIEALKNYLEEL